MLVFPLLERAFGRITLGTAMVLAPLAGCLACHSAEARTCLAGYETAQGLVLKVDAKSEASVGESLKAVEAALAACRTANRHQEVDQLIKARNELSAQVATLERRARRKRTQAPNAEELARLVQHGDDACPRGQAYRLEGATKDIRCTGPQLAEMSLARAKAHFEELAYRVSAPSPKRLDAEHGAERYQLFYESGEAAPSCVVLVPAPGLPWQEALARATGSNPGRLKNPGSVKMARGTLAYTVDEQEVIVRLGECPPG